MATTNDDTRSDTSSVSDVYPEATTPFTDVVVPAPTWDGNDTDDGSDINPNEPIGDVDLEIVGLLSNTNGWCCSVHTICGESIDVGNVLRLVPTVVYVCGILEQAVKLVQIDDGIEGCTVAFVPRLLIGLPVVQRNVNEFCIVKELYCDSRYAYKRCKSHRNLGMAGVVLVNKIP
jgi:hypothetical protein